MISSGVAAGPEHGFFCVFLMPGSPGMLENLPVLGEWSDGVGKLSKYS